MSSTWLPVNPDHALGVNVADQREDPGSLLQLYRRLLDARRQHDALSRGDCVLLDTDAPDYLAYLRSVEGQVCLIILNMTARGQVIELDLPAGELRLLVATGAHASTQAARAPIHLEAYEGYVAEIIPTATTPRVVCHSGEVPGVRR